MKNKKFLKAIAAVTLSASAAITAFGLAACGGGHTHKYEWETSDPDQHWKVCAEDGEEEPGTRGGHDYVNGVCVCGKTDPNQGGGEDPDPGPGPTPGEEDDSVVVYENDFTEDATVDCIGTDEEAPATGIYGSLSGGETEYTDANKVTIAGGTLNLIDGGVGTVYADLNIETQSLKKIRISLDLLPKADGSKWNLVTFLDANGGKIAYLRTDSNKKVGLSVDGSNVIGSTVACSGTIKVEVTFDLGAGTISATFNGGTATTGTITATSFSSIKFTTAGDAARSLSVDNIVIKAGSTDLDAAGLKTKLEEKYTAMDVATNYTVNGAALTKAYEDGVAAIDAAADNKAAVKAFGDACVAMDAVETDAQVAAKQAAYEKAKADAIAELTSYKGGAANYNEAGEGGNKTDYDAAVTAATAAINGVTLGDDLDAAKAAITEALASGKSAIDGISDNATLRTAAKEAAKTEIANYKTTEIAEITNATVSAAITKIKTDFPTKVDAAVTLANIKAAVNTAKASIDGQIDSLHLSLADHKTDKKDDLAAYVTTVKADLDATADAALITAIDNIVTQANSDIDAVTEGTGVGEYATEDEAKVQVSHLYDQAVTDIENAVAAHNLGKSKTAAKAELVAYANSTEVQQPISQDTALVAELVNYATMDAALLKAIDDVTTPEDLTTTVAACKGEIDKKVAELAKHEYVITVYGADGVTVANVVYGGKITKPANPADTEDARFVNWYTDDNYDTLFDFENTVIYADTAIYAGWRESDVTVTYMVDNEVWKEVPAFSGDTPTLATYDGVISGKVFDYWYLEGGEDTPYTPSALEKDVNITLVAKLRDKTNDDLALTESWTVPAGATSAKIPADGLTVNNGKLFNLTVPNGAAYIINGNAHDGGDANKKFGGVTINSVKYENAVMVSQISSGITNDEKPIVITAKEALKSLKVYLTIASDDGQTIRSGSIYYAVDGIEADEPVAFGEVVIENLEVGAVVTIWAENTNKSGGRLYLGKVEAEIADTFTNSTIETYVDGVLDETIGWNSVKPVTAPTAPVVEGKSFSHWSATDGGEAYTFGSQINPGATLKLYAVFAAADVTVNFYDYDGTTVIKSGVGAVSGKPLATENKPANPVREGYDFVGWAVATGDGAALYDFATNLTAGELNLYAKYVSAPQSYMYTAIESSDSYTTGDEITDGNLFTATAATDLSAEYDTKSGQKVTMTDGSTIDSQSIYSLAVTGVGKKGSSDLIIITAKDSKITVKLYVMGAKDTDWGTVRQFTVYNGSKDDASKVSLGDTSGTKRTVVELTLTIEAGQTAIISAATSNTNANNGIYIYGIVATPVTE